MNHKEATFDRPAEAKGEQAGFRMRGGQRLLAGISLAAMLAASSPVMAQALHAVQENGRVIWTNDGPPERTRPQAGRKAARIEPQAEGSKVKMSGLVYWSSVEKRWKEIPARTTPVRRQAEKAADEVSNALARESGDKAQPESKPALRQAVAREERAASSAEIDRMIDEASARHHVDPSLVRALVKVESNFNPKALSPKGAMGLMQLMPATARRYDVQNPFDAEQNVDAGVRHLKGLLQNFGGDVPLTLAAYNAGEGAVARNKGIPPYAETRNYVRRITNLMGDDGTVTMRASSSAAPIHVRRDGRGQLVITNVD